MKPEQPLPPYPQIIDISDDGGANDDAEMQAVSKEDYDALREYALRRSRDEVLEEAARVADDYVKNGHNQYARHSGRAVATRIRALKSSPPREKS